jgi:hypothetical protein
MKRKQKTITKEYDNNGKILRETEETVEEEDTGYIYPQYPYYPISPKPEWIYRPHTITCENTNVTS